MQQRRLALMAIKALLTGRRFIPFEGLYSSAALYDGQQTADAIALAETRTAAGLPSPAGAQEGLDTPSADNVAMCEYWDLVGTIVRGAAAMRAAGKKYLPKFANETAKDYTARAANAKFTNIYRDVLEGLAAKPFQEQVALGDEHPAPPEIVTFCEDVDGSGNTLNGFAVSMFFDGINNAIDWIFVDFPKLPNTGTPRTVADEKALGVRPYWSHVKAKNVLEVRSTIINGREAISYIRILEPPTNGEPERVRIMYRSGNLVGFELWKMVRIIAKRKQFVLEDSGPITIDEIPMVPFITGRRDGKRWYFEPAMRDAADLQVELYQQESGLKNIKNLTAFPVFAGQGVKPEMMEDGKTPKTIQGGPASVFYAPPNGQGNSGTWAILEPSAASATFLSNDNEKTIQQLRELGRQPLTAQSGNLTVITTRVAAGKANSAVQLWAFSAENSLEEALIITSKWLVITGYDPDVNMFKDFEIDPDGNDLDTLTSARKNKDISGKTYTSELKRRNVLGADYDYEKDQEDLLAEGPGDSFTNVDALGNPIPPPVGGPVPPIKKPVVPNIPAA